MNIKMKFSRVEVDTVEQFAKELTEICNDSAISTGDGSCTVGNLPCPFINRTGCTKIKPEDWLAVLEKSQFIFDLD